LALEFDDWYVQLFTAFSHYLTLRQTSCLLAFHSYLSNIGGEENEELWTDEAFVHRQEWKDVSTIGAMVISSFSADPPQEISRH